jgi:hypothetical protein
MQNKKQQNVKIKTADGNTVVELHSIKRLNENLIMDAKVLDAMQMELIVTPGEVLNAARMVLPVSILYILVLPFLSLKRLISGKKNRLQGK